MKKYVLNSNSEIQMPNQRQRPNANGIARSSILPFGFESISSLRFRASLVIGFFGSCYWWLCVREAVGSFAGRCRSEHIFKNYSYPFNVKTGMRISILWVFLLFQASCFSERPGIRAESRRPLPNSTYTNGLGMVFVPIPPGTFVMGSPSDDPGRDADETMHTVTISEGFYMQTTEVTQGQWLELMGDNPSYFKGCGMDCPVENVSWVDSQLFIRRLNDREGTNKYRLPTEAEWEYACKAGSETAFANGKIEERLCGYEPNLDKMGWYCGNSGKSLHPVARKQPNVWGLYDMHGNVWEWCEDRSDWEGKSVVTDTYRDPVVDPVGRIGAGRVNRGGAWTSYARFCRSSFRNRSDPHSRKNSLGFRLARRW